MFIDKLKETLNENFNVSVTENNAIGYRTTGVNLLDINFSVTSLRAANINEISNKFSKAFYENKLLAVKWLFYARDVKEGIGERRLFRICIEWLAKYHPDIVQKVIPLIPVYGRWDDLLPLLNSSNNNLLKQITGLISNQLKNDLNNADKNNPISLIAKWLPSVNTSSKETKKTARLLVSKLGMTEKEYRKKLSKLRCYLKVVEVYMSKNEWGLIDYSTVPSRANLIYNQAFFRNDEERRRAYLDSLVKGESKINSDVLFPHNIVHKYFTTGKYNDLPEEDNTTLEELWKALPNYANSAENTLCVADGSGSMYTHVGKTNVTALSIANALAIYFAERCSGEFHNTFITFSEHPQLVDLNKGKSLREKLDIINKYDEVANTNIEAVFDLILTTALNKNLNQNELPKNILILSDMEFDCCVCTNYISYNQNTGTFKKDFQKITEKYTEHGYKLPRLVFWNIMSKTKTIPLKENDLGIALVSGFSPAIIKMVLSNKIDPLECLLEQINSKRYQPIEEAIKSLL